jgi:Glycosyl transferase family 11
MRESVVRLIAKTLAALRRGRAVAWAPEWMGLGNLLTLGQWAHAGELAGERRYVLMHDHRAPMLDMFPELKERYFLPLSRVRLLDQRLFPWRSGADPQGNAELRSSYIRNVLMPRSPVFEPRPGLEGLLVVNVRRGDYYSNDEHRFEFGYDVRGYVTTAVRMAVAAGGAPRGIFVVSDGIEWCRETLGDFLVTVAPVEYGRAGDPLGDLASLVRAERLILPNSTFSYWGGFMGDELGPNRQVWVPWLFSRRLNGGSCAGQVSASWNVVDDIPGGWAVPE